MCPSKILSLGHYVSVCVFLVDGVALPGMFKTQDM